jgi:hypothetical protein
MTLPKFTRDGGKDEISPREWLRLVKEYGMTPSWEEKYLFDED